MNTSSLQDSNLSRRALLRALPSLGVMALALSNCRCQDIPVAFPELMEKCLEQGTGDIPSTDPRIIEAWADVDSLAATSIEGIFHTYSIEQDMSVEVALPSASGSSNNTTEKFLTAVAGGTPPHIYLTRRSTTSNLAHQGFLMEIRDMALDAGVNAEAYYAFAWAEVGYKGGIYALPFDASTRALMYNKQWLEEVGFDPEQPPQDLDEWISISDQLTYYNIDGSIARMGCNPIYDQATLYTWGFSFGGRFQDPENERITCMDENNVAAMEASKTWIDHIGAEEVEAMLQLGETINLLQEDRVAMTVTVSWNASNLLCCRENDGDSVRFGVAPVPGPNGLAPFASWSGGLAWMIPQGTTEMELAIHILAYVCGEEGQLQYCQDTRRLPTHRDVSQNADVLKAPLLAPFVALLEFSHTPPPIPASAELWALQAQAIRYEIPQDIKTPAEALRDIDDTINAALEDAGFFDA